MKITSSLKTLALGVEWIFMIDGVKVVIRRDEGVTPEGHPPYV
jgi:hypothetical protein